MCRYLHKQYLIKFTNIFKNLNYEYNKFNILVNELHKLYKKNRKFKIKYKTVYDFIGKYDFETVNRYMGIFLKM